MKVGDVTEEFAFEALTRAVECLNGVAASLDPNDKEPTNSDLGYVIGGLGTISVFLTKLLLRAADDPQTMACLLQAFGDSVQDVVDEAGLGPIIPPDESSSNTGYTN